MIQQKDRSPAEDESTTSRQRVLRAVRASSGGCGVKELSERIGLHPNTVRFHLSRLETEGLIHRQVQRAGDHGRPPLRYVAPVIPDAEGQHREFGQLAKVLARLLARTSSNPAGLAVDAGRSWGQRLVKNLPAASSHAEALAVLTGILDREGFAPRVLEGPTNTVVLQRHCPFLEAAQDNRQVVCSVHLGLMQGILRGVQAPVTTECLEPFASPKGCEALLKRCQAPASRPQGQEPLPSPGH